MNIDLSGKTLFITGGSGGIGSVICDYFSSSGAEVISPCSRELDLSSERNIAAYGASFM